MLTQLRQFWLDIHHADTFVDIVVACSDHARMLPNPQQVTITGHCRCDKGCKGLCIASAAAEGGDSVDGDTQHVMASLPCHAVVLSAASTYFSALLSPTWSEGCPSRIKRIPVVLADTEDITAMVALLKCIYTNDVLLQPADLAAVTVAGKNTINAAGVGVDAALAGVTAASMCSCTDALQEIQANLNSMCWQELCVRVLRLADQFSVPGVLQAAVGKLSCLFSYQLSWPAVLAVLWLPAAVAQQPLLKALRQMAINRVTQDMKHLDPCLSTSLGRSILQHLPPDALATLLASDQLALMSENTTLAAIDVWLAGPVASSLSLMSGPDDQAGPHTHTSRSQRRGDSSRDSSRDGSALTCAAAGSDANAAPNGGGQRLAAALQLLVRQVRLPLCSGAFLAAAVSQRPWLCLGMQGSHELRLMQQYYSSDSQGRYDLAMQLLRSGQSCPWSVMLRRGLPSTISSSISSVYSSNSSSNSAKGTSSNGSSKPGLGTYTGLSQLRALLEDGSPSGASSPSCLSSSSSSPDLTQQQLLLLQQAEHVQAKGIAKHPSIMIDEKVMAGYRWHLSLVAVQVPDNNSSSSSSCCSDVCEQCMRIIPDQGSDSGVQSDMEAQKVKRLCLSVCCRPAWANVLDDSSPDYDAAAVSHSAAAAAAAPLGAPAAAAAARAGPMAACGAVLHASRGAAERQAAQVCATCDALWTIAGAKAAEAIARHAPQPSFSHQLAPGMGPGAARQQSPHCCSCAAANSAAATDYSMMVCEEAAAGSGAGSWGGSAGDSCSHVQVPGFCGQEQGQNPGRLVHLDVVVGIQLVAASSREQLQQLIGDGTSSSQGSGLCHVPCLLMWDSAQGAARGLVPIDVGAIDAGSNVLLGSGSKSGARSDGGGGRGGGAGGVGGSERGSGSAGGVLNGWQPELWSGLAPSGALYWHSSLRPLMD